MDAFETRPDGAALCAVGWLEARIPARYFKMDVAREDGEDIVTMGIMELVARRARGAEGGSAGLMVVPVELRMARGESWEEGAGDDKVVVHGYAKGEVVVRQTSVAKSADAVKRFMRLLHNGRLPSSLPYDRVIHAYLDCLSLNAQDLEVPHVILESIVSEVYRDPADASRPWRRASEKSKSMPPRPENIKNIAMRSDTFAALAFENINTAVVASLVRARRGEPEAGSPLERTLSL